MCLLTYQKKAIRLKEDLIVFKIVNKKNCGVFQGFKYKKKVLNKVNMETDHRADAYDDLSYDTYYEPRLPGSPYKLKSGVIAISKGFHAALNAQRLEINIRGGEIIKQFLIPKGSLVYYDKTGLIVSNQIKML